MILETDNASTVSFLNRGSAKNAEAMLWVKLLFRTSCNFDFYVTARHIAGELNVNADILSRLLISPVSGAAFENRFDSSLRSLPEGYFFSYPCRRSSENIEELAPLWNGGGVA